MKSISKSERELEEIKGMETSMQSQSVQGERKV